MSDATETGPAIGAPGKWVQAPLARFLTLNADTVDVDSALTYPTIGVLNRGRGLLYRDPVAGSSTSYKKLNRIGPGELVYSRLKAFEGAITVTPGDLPESFASQEFPTFTFAPDADPDFFRILTTTQGMWDALQAASKGMGGRRERVKPADFLNIVMDIPPLPVQERIVEVVLISATAGGTSQSMVKINKRGFSTVQVPVPPLPEQSEYVQRCDAAVEGIAAIRAEADRLREARTGLLTGLLDCTIEIKSAELEG